MKKHQLTAFFSFWLILYILFLMISVKGPSFLEAATTGPIYQQQYQQCANSQANETDMCKIVNNKIEQSDLIGGESVTKCLSFESIYHKFALLKIKIKADMNKLNEVGNEVLQAQHDYYLNITTSIYYTQDKGKFEDCLPYYNQASTFVEESELNYLDNIAQKH